MSSLIALFYLQPRDIQFTVTEEESNQKIFTCKKLESKNFDILLVINLILDN